MTISRFPWLALSLGASLASAAGNPQAAAPRDPADAAAPVAATVYRSPFSDYRPFSVSEVGPWRAVNDEVGRIGGWRVYAREAYEASEAAKAPGAGSSDKASPPPGGGAAGR